MSRPILLGMGTRPEIIKMAPVYQALRAAGEDVQVLHTGQHDSMAWPVYDFFGMPPRHVMALERGGSTLSHLSAALLLRLQGELEQLTPRAVLVHGDTSSAAMLALAAFYNQIPVGHIEAGLRSGDTQDPFPEEMNRQIVGRIARWHFAPTEQAVQNLRRENVEPARIHLVGNTVVDATRHAVEVLEQRSDKGANMLPASMQGLREALVGRSLVVVTAHRRENWGHGIARIASAVMQLLARHDNLVVAWPVHANPLVRDTVHAAAQQLPAAARSRLFLAEPLNYPAMMYLLLHSWLALTDSGGIQEEAVSHGVPVLVMRETTERPEVLTSGAGHLVGTQPLAIVGQVERLLGDAVAHRSMRSARNPFGDGQAGTRIAAVMCHAMQVAQVAQAA
jgi:UDP-N-acetylglucosamine 2-epimerase